MVVESGEECADDDGKHECVDGCFLAFELAECLDFFLKGCADINVKDWVFFVEDVPDFIYVDADFVLAVNLMKRFHDELVHGAVVAKGVWVFRGVGENLCWFEHVNDLFEHVLDFWVVDFIHDFRVVEAEEDGFRASEKFADLF